MEKKKKGLAIASLCLGILGIAFSFCGGIGMVIGIPGLILGIVGLVKKQGALAIVGTILSIIALGFGYYVYDTADTTSQTPAPAPTTQGESSQQKEPEKSTYGIGDSVEIKDKKGNVLYTLVINSVSKVEKNPYSDKEVAEVIDIDYTYENIAKDTDLLIPSMSFKVYDSNNSVAETYFSTTMKAAQSITQGSNCTAIMSYGLENTSDTIKIDYYDNPFIKEINATWELDI